MTDRPGQMPVIYRRDEEPELYRSFEDHLVLLLKTMREAFSRLDERAKPAMELVMDALEAHHRGNLKHTVELFEKIHSMFPDSTVILTMLNAVKSVARLQ
jgi:hypothetical protein